MKKTLFILTLFLFLTVVNSNALTFKTLASVNFDRAVKDVYVSGNLAYLILDGAPDIEILDVGNPSSPIKIGSIDTPGEAQDIVVSDTIAYVADGSAGLTIIDISTPSSPPVISSFKTEDNALKVFISGSMVYVSQRNKILKIDVTDSASPKAFGATYADDIFVSGNNILFSMNICYSLGKGSGGCYASFSSADITKSDLQDVFVKINLLPFMLYEDHEVIDYWILGNTLYATILKHGRYPEGTFVIADITDKSSYPSNSNEIISELNFSHSIDKLFISGTKAYLTIPDNGLLVIGINNPKKPRMLGLFHIQSGVHNVFVSDNIAYVADNNGGLQVIKVSEKQGCEFTVKSSKQTLKILGEKGKFKVVAPDTCSWIAATDSDWILFDSNIVGRGNGTVKYHSKFQSQIDILKGQIFIGDNALVKVIQHNKSPKIKSLSRESGFFGDTVKINGKYFGKESGRVLMDNDRMHTVSWSDTSVTVKISWVRPGKRTIRLYNKYDLYSVNKKKFIYERRKPIIEDISQKKRNSKYKLSISGENLGVRRNYYPSLTVETNNGEKMQFMIKKWRNDEIKIKTNVITNTTTLKLQVRTSHGKSNVKTVLIEP